MLVKELYQKLESQITEENKEIIKGYYDFVKQKKTVNKSNFMNNRQVTLEELNKKFNDKFEAGSHLDTVFIKNGNFNISFVPNIQPECEPYFLIEDFKNGTAYRTIVTDHFTKTSSILKDDSIGFKEQIGFSNLDRKNLNEENVNKILNLNIGDFVIDLIYSQDKKCTNKEIQDLVAISFPESKASEELVATFVEHQAKLKDIINNKVENKVQKKPTM